MSKYIEYLEEIEQRKSQELDPKPIDGAELLSEIISQIKDNNHKHRKDSLNFFISAFLNKIQGFFATEQTSFGLKAVTDSSQSGSLMSTIGEEKK